MATKSTIAIWTSDGIKAIYCHWDGYPEHNGEILQKFYDEKKTLELISLGDLSSLGFEIGQKHSWNTYEVGKSEQEKIYANNWCKFYARDRGETDCESKTFSTIDELLDHYTSSDYFYLNKNGTWYILDLYQDKKWELLQDYLEVMYEEQKV